jgi:hypothetical protein
MSHSNNLGSFFKESKPLLKEYVDTRLDLFRLQAVRIVSKSAGYLVWVLISLFLFFIIMIFTGIVIGCWFSNMFHSYVIGFSVTTLLMVLIFATLAIFRKALFIQPLMQGIIKKALEEYEEDKSGINDL